MQDEDETRTRQDEERAFRRDRLPISVPPLQRSLSIMSVGENMEKNQIFFDLLFLIQGEGKGDMIGANFLSN